MKILYSGLKYTNYDPKLGLSFEHNNFYESLRKFPGVELIYFPYERILELGMEEGNATLLELVKKEKPDLFFAFMFTDELLIPTLEQLKKSTTSLAWFSDDSWRFWNYSRFYAPHFTWVATTYSWLPELYRRFGQSNVIRSQWAANTEIFRPVPQKRNIDVSFVGGWSRPRQKIISALQKAGINVEAFGKGWPDGRVSGEEMIRIFSESKINLGLNPAPGYFNFNSLGRLVLRRSMDKIVPDMRFISNFRSWLQRGVPQIKARHFEIPACKGFLITEMADDLDKFYEIGEEIIVYRDISDLIEKIKYYLNHDEERGKIASAGYKRTIQEHTYENRFLEIFAKVKGALG